MNNKPAAAAVSNFLLLSARAELGYYVITLFL
jgi:hypothetical protein